MARKKRAYKAKKKGVKGKASSKAYKLSRTATTKAGAYSRPKKSIFKKGIAIGTPINRPSPRPPIKKP